MFGSLLPTTQVKSIAVTAEVLKMTVIAGQTKINSLMI